MENRPRDVGAELPVASPEEKAAARTGQSAAEEVLRLQAMLQKKSEQLADAVAQLHQREQELAEFFENASIGLHWVGPDGRILRVNRAELDLLGYSREEYVGRPIADFHCDPEVIADYLKRLAAGESLRDCPARMRCKDGSIKEVLIDSSVLWEEGRFVHTRCFLRDTSSRQQMEETQDRLAAIIETSQDAIVSKTLDSRITSWNAAAERLFGYSAAEAVGQSIMCIIPPERQDEERMILDRLRRGERIEHYETLRMTKDGRRIDISLSISPLRDREGRIIGASKIARDITAGKRAVQRQLAHSAVTHALADAGAFSEAAPKILQALAEHLGWEVGGFWCMEPKGPLLRCAAMWRQPTRSASRLEADSHERTFARGEGMPGRVWRDARAVWIADLAQADDFPRAAAARADGLHTVCAIPLILHEEVLGVLEFFGREVRLPDDDTLHMLALVGSQVGQFLERQRAEAALRESEQRFRLMAEAVPSIIWTAAPDGTITYANPRWFEYCGLTPDANARDWPELVLHPDDQQRCLAAWRAALRSGTEYEIEIRNRRRDGAYRWFVSRALPYRDAAGQIVQWFGSSQDIDDRKRAEQTSRFLAFASATLAELTDYRSTLQRVAALAVPAFADWCAIDMRDADGTVQRLAVTHTDPAKVQLALELDRQYPPRPWETQGVRQVIRTGQAEWAAAIPDELLTSLTQGEEHLRIVRELGFKSYICVPLKSRRRVLGALTFVTAESGRVYDETDLAAARDLADRAVLAIENANLLARLKDADRRKDEFLAMLAHELRNPLAPIRNAAYLFRTPDAPAPRLLEAAQVIDRQLHQLTRLVDDLLDVSRITRGKIELRTERVPLADILHSAVEASRPVLEKKGHVLTLLLPPQPIYLEVDPTRLAQVVLNLLHNAAKYTDPGGRIELSAGLHEGQAQIRVQDNGIGIPTAMLGRIFEMFLQVDPARERAEGGLGIGLTLVQRLVELHGGTVQAWSEGPGRGSLFTVRLPAAPPPEAFPPPRPAAAVSPAPRRILVVDDNRDAADTLGMLLRLQGHEIRTAYDGLEALEAAAAFQPAVVLLDIGLPRLNGYDAARRLRDQEGGADRLLIALTGWGQEEDRRRSREAGFDHHLTKPVDFAALQRLLAPPPAGNR